MQQHVESIPDRYKPCAPGCCTYDGWSGHDGLRFISHVYDKYGSLNAREARFLYKRGETGKGRVNPVGRDIILAFFLLFVRRFTVENAF